MTREEYGSSYAMSYLQTVRFLRNKNFRREDAEEIAQSAWMLGWERLSQFRDDSLVQTWVNSIALNIGRSKVRREKGLIVYKSSHDTTIQPKLNEKLDAERLLNFCNPEYRRLLAMQHLEGLSIEEIVEMTGKNENTVKIQLFRGRIAIRERAERRLVRNRIV